jgi:hypothetical protein
LKVRLKKPFNPMLGETYELVTEDFRWFSEQVSHHPPISAFIQEGKGYVVSGFMHSKSKFGFGGGKGMLEVSNLGYQDYYYEKYNETISVGRNNVTANNVAFGQFYLDVSGDIDAINHRTHEKAIVKFYPRGWSSQSYIEG